VVVRGGAIWLSEPPAVIVVVALLAVLSLCGVRIAYNAYRIRGGERTITALEREEIDLRHKVEELQGREQLEQAVRVAVGQRVPDRTVRGLAELVDRGSRQYGYDPLLVLAVIRVESYYDPRARGRYKSGRESGAIGLMQLQLETAQIIGRDIGIPVHGEKDLYDPQVNAALGVAYLTKLIARFRSFKLGLLAYNQGPAVIEQNLRERRPLSVGYYERVLAAYDKLRARVKQATAASWE
jgi:hypothetical protein